MKTHTLPLKFHKTNLLAVVSISVLFFLLYDVTATRVFSYDALCYALDIEFGFFAGLFHPNHVLFSFVGWLLMKAVTLAGYPIGALFLLQKVNAVVGAAAVGLFAWILAQKFGWKRGLFGAAALGVSQAFWVEAVDAGCYAWASLAACILLAAVIYAEDLPPFWLGALHGLTILFHQLLVLAVPAVLLKVGWKKTASYLAGVAIVAGGVYALIAVSLYGNSFHEAMRWMWGPARQAHGTAVNFFYWFTFDLGRGIWLLWQGLVHSFIAPVAGGSVWVSVLEHGLLLLVAVFVLGSEYRYFKGRRFSGDTAAALWVWVLVVNLFLIFYIPGATRFRLLFLPPLIYLVLDSFERYKSRLLRPIVAVIAISVMAFVNFREVAGPQARPENSPNLLRSVWVARTLKPGDTFLFSGTGSDSIINVYVAYFAPHLHGRSVRGYFFENPQGNLGELQDMVRKAKRDHSRIFLEAALFDSEKQRALDTAGQIPPGTLHRWLSTFHPGKEWVGPMDYRIDEVQ